MLFNVDNAGQISFVSKLEEDKKAETNSKFSAKHLFQTRDKMGVSDVADTILNTTHQNQVCAKFSAVKVKKKTKFDGCRVSKHCHFFLHVYQYFLKHVFSHDGSENFFHVQMCSNILLPKHVPSCLFIFTHKQQSNGIC